MGLLSFLATLGRICWPFIQENFLKDGTLKDFIVRNKALCFWLTMLVVMLGTQVYLFDSAMAARRGEVAAKQEAEQAKQLARDLQRHRVIIETDLRTSKKNAADLQEQLTALRTQYDDLSTSNDKYESWLHHCGVNLNHTGPGYPQCKARYSAPRATKPQRAPTTVSPPVEAHSTPEQPERKGFWNGLKRIFNPEKTGETKPPQESK